MKPISPTEREYLDSLQSRSRRKRSKPKPGRPEEPDREKCVCFLSTCVTESEMDAFERLRLREAFPPSRSTFNRFLIKEALHHFRDGFPDTFVAAWAASGLPQWWGPETAAAGPVAPQGGHDCGSAVVRSAAADPAKPGQAALSCYTGQQLHRTLGNSPSSP